MSSAAIYARVSSARQKKDETIGSQTAALREHAEQARLDVPEEWVFEDEGHSGATLVRPALEALRDLAAQGCLDVVLCYSPDRLARKFAYQALLLEEFARAGVRVEFVKGPRGDTPEDQLLVQFQGIFAEYEKAQLAERYRRGKAHRARTGSVNVLSGAPFGYRYVRKTDLCGAAYEVLEHEAALVAEMFRRYADDGAAIADLARWLTGLGVPTRTGKNRWDRSVIWAMLRNPAYAGRAVFGKTMATSGTPGLNRVARLQGRTTPRAVKTVDRPREQWLEIPVPAIVVEVTFARVQQRLEEASPLLANVYLHYVLDLWADWWRNRKARGDVIIVRWADDFIVGFEHRGDAERFLAGLRERFAKFGLELHPDKTRLIEFGRFAVRDRAARGEGKPETFDFLGFTHICATAKGGQFWVKRITIAKRMRAKLKQVKDQLRRRMHQPIPVQGRWLASVVRGHMAYYGVPGNSKAVEAFRNEVTRHWLKALRRRSQKGQRLTWARMRRIHKRWLPPVRVMHPFPEARFAAMHPR